MAKPFKMNYRQVPPGNSSDWFEAFQARMGLAEAKKVMGANDPRTILGVTSTATWTEIRSAYRRMVMETHPDRGGTVEAFRRVQAAYEILEQQR